ncbi:MAG: hypothetical protein AAGJ52_10210 [Pseudomonadota bacterium]
MKPIAALAAAFALTLMGCAAQPRLDRDSGADEGSGGSGVVLRIDGESLVLGNATGSPLTPPLFVAQVQQQLLAGRNDRVENLVRTYPSSAQQAVLSPNQPVQIQQVVAVWLDWISRPAAGGWVELVADRLASPQRYQDWQTDRAAVLLELQRGEFSAVADRAITPMTEAPSPWANLELTRLRATAALAAGRPEAAAPLFARASEQAAMWNREEAAQFGLFATLAYQQAGDLDAARLARERAIEAVDLAQINNPMTLRLMLETAPDGAADALLGRRAIRARLGRLELNRNMPQAALLAWRAAESELGQAPSLERLRLSQAEALIALGQSDPAVALLIGLSDSDLRPEALVMLGLVQMSKGQVDVGLAAMNEAVAATDADHHPSIYADSGLALLSVGEQAEGLARISAALTSYQDRNEIPEMRSLLDNQLRYAQAIGDTGLIQRTRQALQRLGDVGPTAVNSLMPTQSLN